MLGLLGLTACAAFGLGYTLRGWRRPIPDVEPRAPDVLAFEARFALRNPRASA